MQTVVLKRFDHYFSAHILSTKLRDAGVESYLFDENSITIGPFLSNALGGIKLVVDEQDEVRARILLSEFDEEYRKFSEEFRLLTFLAKLQVERPFAHFILKLARRYARVHLFDIGLMLR